MVRAKKLYAIEGEVKTADDWLQGRKISLTTFRKRFHACKKKQIEPTKEIIFAPCKNVGNLKNRHTNVPEPISNNYWNALLCKPWRKELQK
jgi:hypothetical protein